jgi:hypothetical protein
MLQTGTKVDLDDRPLTEIAVIPPWRGSFVSIGVSAVAD